MIKILISAMVKDLVEFLSENRNFFEQNSDQKKKLLEKSSMPDQIRDMLAEINPEKIVKEIEEIITSIEKPTSTFVTSSSQFCIAVKNFLSNDLASILDAFEMKNTTYSHNLKMALADILQNNNYEELVNETNNYISKIAPISTIVVQTARETTPEFKKELREQLKKEHPSGIPLFTTNKKLLGGIRIFINGHTQDYSWIGKINEIISPQHLTY